MQFFRHDEQDAALVGWGVRVLLLAPAGSATPHALARLGGLVHRLSDAADVLALLAADPAAFGLVVVECDAIGGLTAGQDLAQRMGVPVPVLLVSAECRQQVFPPEATAPVQLRAPLSAVALRVGFEHALRDRLTAAA